MAGHSCVNSAVMPIDLAVGGDAGRDLFEPEPHQVAAEVAGLPLGRTDHRVDDLDLVAGPLDGAGDVGQAERRRDRQAREAERLDRRWANEADRTAVVNGGHVAPRLLPRLGDRRRWT